MIGTSAPMQRVREFAARAARSRAAVILTGETGAGKEVLARAIHEESPRADGPFVAVDCAAVPAHLLESELFGHARGAFTGAVEAHRGRFEEAHGGTLFLDEVDELPHACQAKLLRALQEHAVRPLGATRVVPLDLRVVAARKPDPPGALAPPRLRRDFYYRISALEIEVPPLRERRGDLLPLTLHFLQALAHRSEHPILSPSEAALEAMECYSWPGNVRELGNALERAAVFATPEDGGVLHPASLPAAVRRAGGYHEGEEPAAAPLDLAAAVRRVRRRYLGEALRLAHGNRSEASRLLGISRRALYDLLAEVGDPG